MEFSKDLIENKEKRSHMMQTQLFDRIVGVSLTGGGYIKHKLGFAFIIVSIILLIITVLIQFDKIKINLGVLGRLMIMIGMISFVLITFFKGVHLIIKK